MAKTGLCTTIMLWLNEISRQLATESYECTSKIFCGVHANAWDQKFLNQK